MGAISIVKTGITLIDADAIVNAANEGLRAGAPSHVQGSCLAACVIAIGNTGRALGKCFDDKAVDTCACARAGQTAIGR